MRHECFGSDKIKPVSVLDPDYFVKILENPIDFQTVAKRQDGKFKLLQGLYFEILQNRWLLQPRPCQRRHSRQLSKLLKLKQRTLIKLTQDFLSSTA